MLEGCAKLRRFARKVTELESFGAKFGQLVRRYREAQGLSAAELALAAFGDEAKRSRISELENGKVKRPQAKTISALQVYLNIPQKEVDGCRKPTASDADVYLRQQSADAKEAIQQSGLSDQQLLVLVQAFKDANEPKDRWFELLLEKAPLLQDLQARLSGISNDDPEVDKLRQRAEQAIDDADFAGAEALLEQAEAIDAEACAKLRADMDEKQQTLNQRTESQAGSAFARGELAEARLRYTDAYKHYRRAYELTPDDEARLVKAGKFAWLGGEYAESARLNKKHMSLLEEQYGPDSPEVADTLNNIAVQYWQQGEHADAEPLIRRAIEIDEKALGPEHPSVATGLGVLAVIQLAQGKHTQAEPLLKRAIDIGEETLGPNHPNLAIRLNNFAQLYKAQGKYDEAEPLYLRAIAILESAFPDGHPNLDVTRANYAELKIKMG